MAKKKNQVESTEAEAGVEAEAKEAAVRGTVITKDDGTVVRRLDYIRELWASKTMTRGEIKNEIIRLGGKEIPYQIIFSATKGLEGGRVVEKAPKAEKKAKGKKAAEEAAGEEAAA